MKKLLTAILLVAATFGIAKADDHERPTTVDQLPQKAQEFLNTHFKDLQVAFAIEEQKFMGKEYEVIYTDRTEVKFDTNGEWEEVDGKRNNIPTTIIPAHIKQYVEANYPGVSFTKIERDRGEVEVELTNRLSLTFNKKGQLIDIDD